MNNVVQFPTEPLRKNFERAMGRLREYMTEQEIGDWIMETVKAMGLVQDRDGVWRMPDEVTRS